MELFAGTNCSSTTQYRTNVHRLDAIFDNPQGMCQDVCGHMYVVDSGNTVIRRIDAVTGGW